MAAQFSKPHACQLAGSRENVCLALKGAVPATLQHSPFSQLSRQRAGMPAGWAKTRKELK